MVDMFFLSLITVVIAQRLGELWIAKKNASFMLKQGAIEIGAKHYKWIVLVHVLFFFGLFIEVASGMASRPTVWWLPFSIFIVAQAFRVWCIASLGRFWNTRIFVLPGANIVNKGPYRWMKHPNYAVVMIEILVLPLIFGAYVTAITISLINLMVLMFIRIPAEEKALQQFTNKNAILLAKEDYNR
jgi:methyltransferase